MSDGAKSPPIGVVLDTRIEDGDRGDEDVNSQTPQTARVELTLGEQCFVGDEQALMISNVDEPLPLIYGRERVPASPETTYATYARAMSPVEHASPIAESSDLYAISKGMKGLAQGAEADARLRGLMAILSLPLVREGKVLVQVEVLPDTWQRVDGVSIDDVSITFLSGTNGKATPFKFLNAEGMPAWRTVALSKRQRHTLEHE